MRETRSKLLAAVFAAMLLPAAPLVQGLVDDGATALEASDAGTVRPGGAVLHDAGAKDRAEPGLLEDLDAADGPLPLIVQFHDRDVAEATADDLIYPDLAVHYTFGAIPAVHATAPPATVRRLAQDERVRFVEAADKPLRFHLDSATRSSRARDVWDPDVSPDLPVVTDADGNVVDGSGVGVAVLDTGVDATHPDLPYGSKVARNLVATPAGVVEGGPYAASGGHGTHVAGIVAGNGAASDGRFAGVAPGATLTSLRVGSSHLAFGTVLSASVAMDWVLAHGADQDPPIRVVVNAWSCSSASCRTFHPDRAHVQLASELAEAGYVVLHAAGDEGGNGLASRTNAEATNPTPGILGVGDYDDEDFPLRSLCVSGSSSKGRFDDPSTWPDLVAPGDETVSPQAVDASFDPRPRIPVLGRGTYTEFGDTSAATAHMGGVVALMLDANPALSPAEVEFLAKNSTDPLSGCSERPTEMVRASPAHPWDPANYWVGHGLIDAYDAVAKAQAFDGLPAEAPPLEPLPEAWPTTEEAAITGPFRTFYLTGEDGLSEQAPPPGPPRTAAKLADTGLNFTSGPLPDGEGFTTSGVEVDAWIGTNGECPCIKNNNVQLQATVARVRPDGSTEVVAEDRESPLFTYPGSPIYRDWRFPLDAPVTFDAGDRVRVRLSVLGLSTSADAQGNWVLYWDARETPSRVLLGEATQDIAPGSPEECQVTGNDCVRIGGARRSVPIDCDFDVYRVRWTGPPGSSATVSCRGAVATCTVPGQAGDPWATCEAASDDTVVLSGHGLCTYTTPDGAPVEGQGRCEVVESDFE